MTEKDQHWIAEVINKLPIDIRAEVIIADLIELGLEKDDVVVSPVGLGKRSFSNDILGAKWIENKSERELLFIQVSREAIYDALPEGLFHQPKTKKTFPSTVEMISMVKQAKEEENDSRKFFAPYEQEFYRQRVAIESQERKTLSQLKETARNDLFSNFWPLNNFFSPGQVTVMRNLLPLTHKIAGDFGLMSQSFENVLRTKTRINEILPVAKTKPLQNMPVLGTSTLGVDAVLGNSCNDGDPAVELIIGPLNADNVLDFIPGGRGLKVIDCLLEYFMPVEIDVTLKLLVDENTFNFTLESKTKSMGRLGYNTALKKSKLNANIA